MKNWWEKYDFREWQDEVGFNDLKNKKIKDIKVVDKYEIYFLTEDEICYKMYHIQDCCESVYIESFDNDIMELIGQEILSAEESNFSGDNDWGSSTWTFYTLRTFKNTVVIRWYGESNGYYSESVDLLKTKNLKVG